MKGIVIFFSLLLAWVFERWVYFFFPSFLFVPAITLFVSLYWLIRLPVRARAVYAFVVGFFLDVFSVYPFGTYILLCLFFALLSIGFEVYGAESQKRFKELLWGMAVFVASPLLIVAVSSFLPNARGGVAWYLGDVGLSLFSGLLWALVFFAMSAGIPLWLRRIRRT